MLLRKWGSVFLALFLLSGCGQPAVTESVSSESSVSGEVSTAPAPEYATDEITDHRKVSMDFDNIQPAGYYWSREHAIPYIQEGSGHFFTIERDGKWGLILADGTQVLPCLSAEPVSFCSQREWFWDGGENVDWILASEESTLLTDYPTCGGHGGGSAVRFVDLKGESKKPQILHGMEGGGFLEDTITQQYPEDFFATYFSNLIEDGIEYLAEGGYWNFTDESGKVLFPEEQFSMVGEFNNDQPAPVEKDGKWAYVRESGSYVTDFIYEDCWFAFPVYGEALSQIGFTYPAFTYPFYRGFAAVKKDGKWGVIDKGGTEWIPFEFEGAAPHPLGVWLKKDGVWEIRRLKQEFN